MSQKVTDPSAFPLPNSTQYLPVFAYFLQNFLIGDFIHTADPIHVSLYLCFKSF